MNHKQFICLSTNVTAGNGRDITYWGEAAWPRWLFLPHTTHARFAFEAGTALRTAELLPICDSVPSV